MMNDEILMQKIKEGNLQKLTILYDRHSLYLFNFILKMTGDRAISHDLLQDTFERVLKYRHSYKKDKNFRTWIFQIARNLLYDHNTRSSKMDIEYREEFKDRSTGIESDYQKKEEAKLVENVLLKIDSDKREILSMYFLFDHDYKAIAETLDITVNNARTRVCRALKDFKKEWNRYEG